MKSKNKQTYPIQHNPLFNVFVFFKDCCFFMPFLCSMIMDVHDKITQKHCKCNCRGILVFGAHVTCNQVSLLYENAGASATVKMKQSYNCFCDVGSPFTLYSAHLYLNRDIA